MVFKKVKNITPRYIKITRNLINKTLNVYNGKEYHELTITSKMIGYKIGEFSLTRYKLLHKKLKK